MKWLVLLAPLLLTGCGEINMWLQPKYIPYAPSRFWPDGSSARPIPAGTVAQGELELEAAAASPPAVTLALLERGRDEFNTYCTPCHGFYGDGDGIVVQRGFPHPPPLNIARLRHASVRHFFNVQTQGYGVMYSYADRVSASDRWAIAAYIRALQVSHGTELAMVPEAAEKLR